jgi:hypothetical protein
MRLVRVIADRDATLEAQDRWPLFNELVVGVFDESFSLYRVLDGAELHRIVTTGRIEGGRYAAPPERAFGASWGYEIDSVIRGGLGLKGRRIGSDVYLAKIDAFDRKFLHLSPGFSIDPMGDSEQPFEMDAGRCNWGLGCSTAVSLDDLGVDLEFYALKDDGQLRRLSPDELAS